MNFLIFLSLISIKNYGFVIFSQNDISTLAAKLGKEKLSYFIRNENTFQCP